ncbi:MAG TPA: polyprenyl diphosphate synthase [Candidatus Doudnabacteria bacterium]|nr:polyprenyl diphosphate synthase [Candidatus Doudnabacteria bacterium]
MSLPNHLAIIPDGNRRWAKLHRLLPWQGHEQGAKRFWELAEYLATTDIKYGTFWAGSYSNLANRAPEEVKFLFQILEQELSDPKVTQALIDNQTRFQLIGEWENFNNKTKLPETIEQLVAATKDFTRHNLTILFGYDGQREMLAAIEQLKLAGEEVTAGNLRKHLWTGHLPDVDYVIRTGGEPHWSAGFLMWQTANSQFYFTEDLWPDFTTEKLKIALEEFERRERRLGK